MSRERLAYDQGLVGQPGSRMLIDTPALVLDLDAFDANVAAMAKVAAARGVALRPSSIRPRSPASSPWRRARRASPSWSRTRPTSKCWARRRPPQAWRSTC